ncbi:MAG: Na+/H+ antiporter subunit E [bacterium]
MRNFLASFVFLFGFWLILSGKFDVFHLSLGGISCALIANWTGSLVFQDKNITLAQRLIEHFSFYPYACWLFYQIVLANIQVIKIAFLPNVDSVIHPKIITFKTHLTRDISKFVLANSITLTPGTITIREETGTFKIHALNAQAAEGIPTMIKKVGALFGETRH